MDTNKTALSTVLDLALTRTIITRDVDAALGAHGLALPDLALLLELYDAPDGRLRRVELANRLGVTPSGVARQLQPLERIGLVGREPHARDARLALVVLTDTGRRVAEEAVPTAEIAAERALARFWPDAERERLAKLIAAVR
jgi:DNA-binding MarR family transcriptional regulator